MKKYLIVTCFLFMAAYFFEPALSPPPFVTSGANSIPQITITNVTILVPINAVRITYDLADSENDPCKVSLRISNDSGKTYLYPADSVTGDAGYPVIPGTGKQVYWYYSSLVPAGFKAKLTADDLQPVNIQEIVNLADSNRLKNDMLFITGVRHRTTGPAQLQRVKDSIQNRFARYNLQTYVQNFDYSGYNAQNFTGKQQGTTREDTTYIIDGHYETVSISPGADDNGTAVASLLEALRVLSNYNFRNSIRFIGFDLEEAGLVGSTRYVLQGIPAYEKIAGVFNFEMIGYYCETANCQQIPPGFCTLFPAVCDSINSQQAKGNFILNVANVNSNVLRYTFDSCARLYVPQLRVISLSVTGNGASTPDLRRSDHASFWDGGYKALMLTDGANFRNPNYHTANDTVGSINFKFMTNVLKATIASVASAAGIQHSSSSLSGYFSLIPVSQISTEVPEQFSLSQNYPNPFNPNTIIKIQVAKPGMIKLIVYDITGKEVMTLINEPLKAGVYETSFDGNNFTSGVYFYKLLASDFSETRKMVLLK